MIRDLRLLLANWLIPHNQELVYKSILEDYRSKSASYDSMRQDWIKINSHLDFYQKKIDDQQKQIKNEKQMPKRIEELEEEIANLKKLYNGLKSLYNEQTQIIEGYEKILKGNKQ
jgi:seryl-tRNA synthetase